MYFNYYNICFFVSLFVGFLSDLLFLLSQNQTYLKLQTATLICQYTLYACFQTRTFQVLFYLN